MRAGPATLAPGSRAHQALAPEGAGIARLLARRGHLGSGVAIAAPSGLRAAIMNARARSIARRAAALPDAQPHLSYRDFISVWMRDVLGGFDDHVGFGQDARI